MIRRLVSVALLGLALFICTAQSILPGFPPGVFRGRGALDPAAGGGGGRTCTDGTASANFLARVSSPSDTLADAYCEMINGLVADGTIDGNLSGAAGCGTYLNGLYIFWTKDTTTANLNLCGTSFGLTQVGGVTFTANSDYQPNGSTGYFTTGFTTGGVGTQNALSLGAYVLSSRTTGGTVVWGGRTDSGANVYSYMGYSTLLLLELNGLTFSSVTSANAQGFNVITRTSALNINAYRNGSSLGSSVDASAGQADLQMYLVGAYNQNGTAANFSNDKIGAIFFGADVDSKITSLSNRINCMAARQSINVYASTC